MFKAMWEHNSHRYDEFNSVSTSQFSQVTEIQGVFFSSTNTNITITRKVMDRISIGLKRFEEEGHCYKMVKLDQKFVKN